MASFEPTEGARSENDEIDARYLDDPLDHSTFSWLMNSCNLDQVLNHDFIYSMSSYEKIGKCFIFAHTTYDSKLEKLSPRYNGDDYEPDAVKLTNIFQEMKFDADTFMNYNYNQIMGKLTEVAKIGFKNYGCFVCCFLTHGCENGGLYAYDKKYDINDAWSHFRCDQCPTLARKPKIFIVQACQGNEQNCGKKNSFLEESRDSEHSGDSNTPEEDYGGNFDDEIIYMPSIPPYADFITAFATYNG